MTIQTVKAAIDPKQQGVGYVFDGESPERLPIKVAGVASFIAEAAPKFIADAFVEKAAQPPSGGDLLERRVQSRVFVGVAPNGGLIIKELTGRELAEQVLAQDAALARAADAFASQAVSESEAKMPPAAELVRHISRIYDVQDYVAAEWLQRQADDIAKFNE